MLEHFDDIFDHLELLDASWSSWELMLENLEGKDEEVEAQDGVREGKVVAQERIP